MLVPLIVSLVALFGVIVSAVVTSVQNRRAEDRRATALITAENARAQAAIAAEDIRHSHAIEAEGKRRVIEARHAFYERLEAVRRPLLDALEGLQWLRANPKWGAERYSEACKRLEAVVEAFREVRDQAGLYASEAVADTASRTWQESDNLSRSLQFEGWLEEGAPTEQDIDSAVLRAITLATDLKPLLREGAGVDD